MAESKRWRDEKENGEKGKNSEEERKCRKKKNGEKKNGNEQSHASFLHWFTRKKGETQITKRVFKGKK